MFRGKSDQLVYAKTPDLTLIVGVYGRRYWS